MVKRHLQWEGISDKTRFAYGRILKIFFRHLKRSQISWPDTFEELDIQVASFINDMYQEGDSVAYAGHLLSGLRRFLPTSKSKLLTAQQYFRNWQRTHVPIRTLPLPWEVLKAMVSACIQVQHLDLAACLLLGFVFFLRTNEILSLRVGDIRIFNKTTVAVRLGLTKTSKQNEQSLHHDCPFFAKIVAYCLSQREKEEWLFIHSSDAFRNSFSSIARNLSLDRFDFSPYSLRRGGATWFFLQCKSFDHTVQRGRWLDVQTARIYISSSQAALIKLELPTAVVCLINSLNSFWTSFLK